MLEYGIKHIITNPTLITKSTEIIKLVDSRNHKTRAFVLPASYEAIVQKLIKEVEYKKWALEKKKALSKNKETENFDDVMVSGMENITSYLENS